MARVGTPNWGLGTWLQGENPGAGSQTVDNTGLNGNWIKLDKIGVEHYPDGTHIEDIIDKDNLKTSVCDGASTEKDATVGIRVKALGILSSMLGAGAVIAGKILGTGAGKAVDGVTIGLNGSNELEVIDDSIGDDQIADQAITTNKLEYKEYVARITQVSTNAPVATILKNTLGFTPTWSRVSAGKYRMSGTYPEAKTWGMICGGYVTGSCYFGNDKEYGAWQTTRMEVSSLTYLHAYGDDVLSENMLIVRIYP